MNILQSLLYGLVSGISEFLPISSSAHQNLILFLFGVNRYDPLMDVVVYSALLCALLFCCRDIMESIKRERMIYEKNRRTHLSLVRLKDYRLVKDATMPMLILFVICSFIIQDKHSLLIGSLGLLINGIIVFIPVRLMQGNKDSRHMSKLDSVLFGLLVAASALPGISRLGIVTTAATFRGASKIKGMEWALLLCIPAIILLIILNLFALFGGSTIVLSGFFSYVFAFIGAFFGGYFSIFLVRLLTVRSGYSGFAYYCWGAALFMFILYLTIA